MDECAALIGLLILLFVIWIVAKVIGWGAKVAGGIGDYRTGKAMKKISQDGLDIRQPEEHLQQQRQRTPLLRVQTQPSPSQCSYCDQCGMQLKPNSKFCPGCGRKL